MSRYIDADALAEYEENAWDWETVDYIQTTTAINQIISDIRNESTADVRENVYGKWIYKNDNVLIPTGYWECSVCKEGRLMYEQNFCPHCGADMRGEENDQRKSD